MDKKYNNRWMVNRKRLKTGLKIMCHYPHIRNIVELKLSQTFKKFKHENNI